MCDFSLEAVRSRPAIVGDKLTTVRWATGTCGFTDGVRDEVGNPVAVCLRPGTEVAFDKPILLGHEWWRENKAWELLAHKAAKKRGTVARFRQIRLNNPHTHHDALELANGDIVLVTHLTLNQTATVLQLPAEKPAAHEDEAPYRLITRTPTMTLSNLANGDNEVPYRLVDEELVI